MINLKNKTKNLNFRDIITIKLKKYKNKYISYSNNKNNQSNNNRMIKV